MKKPFNEWIEDDSLQGLEDGLLWSSKQKKALKQRIMMNIEELESSGKVSNGKYLSYKLKSHILIRQTLYVGVAFTILAGVFVSSAFLSPTMAQIASKIPYLSKIFNSDSLQDEISKALDAKGYKWDGMGFTVNPREVSVMIVGSDTYYDEVKGPVTELIQDILKSKNYDTYKVNVKKQAPDMSEYTGGVHPEDYASPIVDSVLQKYGYSSSIGVNFDKKQVDFDLPDTETRIEEIKKEIYTGLKEKGMGDFSIKVYTYNLQKKEREDRWMPVFNTIADGLLAKKKYHVQNIGYTNKYTAFTMYITVDIPASNSNVKAVTTDIESTIREYLNSEEGKKIIQDDLYEIVIYSKEKKRIN